MEIPRTRGVSMMERLSDSVSSLASSMLGWPGVAALVGIGSMSLPSAEALAAYIIAVCMGVGIGAGSGYAAFKKKQIEVFKEEDMARRESTLGKLEEATRKLDEASRRDAAMRAEVAESTARINDLEVSNEKLRTDLIDFALRVLQDKGFVDHAAGPPAGQPTGQPTP